MHVNEIGAACIFVQNGYKVILVNLNGRNLYHFTFRHAWVTKRVYPLIQKNGEFPISVHGWYCDEFKMQIHTHVITGNSIILNELRS